MKDFRNYIEYALIMKMSKILICQQDDLDNEIVKDDFDENYPCHIYFITARPRIFLVPEKCEFDRFQFKLVFKIQIGFDFEEKELVLRSKEDTTNFVLKSEFPYSKFYIYKDGEQIIYAKSSLYYFMHLREYTEHMNSELLYIGQSFGKKVKESHQKDLKITPLCKIFIQKQFRTILIKKFG